ncbi:zinc-dependent metalloprotease [Allostreptomyces psammosilenae]|nr:zinc-dependent metalloprotease [Allostreptomyces psammosilenae]
MLFGGGQGAGGGQNPFGFGFSLPGMPGGGQGAGGQGGGDNPFAAMFGNLGAADLGAAFQQLGQMLSTDAGPVNWNLAHDIARRTAAAGGTAALFGQAAPSADPSVTDSERTAVSEAVRLAELWLDEVTSFPAGTGSAEAWSRAEWVEATLPVWRSLVNPVAERVAGAMGGVVPEEMRAMAGPLLGIMRSMGGAMFGTQIGQAIGTLAGEVVGSTDIGLPLGPVGKAALLPANVAAFGEGLGIPLEEVRLYLALRESAHHRLFGHVPWLRQHLLGAVESYARGITVDTSRLEEMVSGIDPTNPEALQEALQGGLFEPQETPEQKAALARLETALALVEGWVDAVVHAAAAPRLPAAAALRETLRRRRATGGPAEQIFTTLVGLQMRPRRLRDASRLWASLTDARGLDGRDALWAHPDMLPTADDLDDPDGFVHREEMDFSELGSSLDESLDRMLGEERAKGRADREAGEGDTGAAPGEGDRGEEEGRGGDDDGGDDDGKGRGDGRGDGTGDGAA